MPEWVIASLKELGVAGAFIFLLVTAISGLCAVIVTQWKQANKVYSYRLAERDTLNKALTDNTAALTSMYRIIEEKTKATEEWADAIDRQAAAFERVNDRIEMQHVVIKEEIVRHGATIANASNVYAKTVEDIRQYLIQTQPRRTR